MRLYSIIDRSEQALASLAYRLKNTKEKLARYKNHLTFLIRCRNNKLVPKGLRISISIESTKAQLIAHRSSQALLRECIKFICKTKVIFTKIIADTEQQIRSMTKDDDQFHRLICWSEENVDEMSRKTKRSQQDKF